MDLPATLTQTPEENQLSEALAWLLDRSRMFAHRFAELFFEPESEVVQLLQDVDVFGAQARISLPPLPGTGVLFPDLSLCGSSRSFQLLVEVKVDAGYHTHPHPQTPGTPLLQPDAYIEAWKQLSDTAGEARIRAVGTLTRGDDRSSERDDPMRARDVTWEELRSLLSELVDTEVLEPSVALIAGDLTEAIDSRVLGRTRLPPQEELDTFLAWAQQLIPALSAKIAEWAVPRKHVSSATEFVGTYVDLVAPDGIAVELWIFANPTGGRYNLPGLPDSLGVRLAAKNAGGGLGQLTPGRIAAGGFRFVRDNDKWKDYRVYLPLMVGTDPKAGAADAADAIRNALASCEPPLLR